MELDSITKLHNTNKLRLAHILEIYDLLQSGAKEEDIVRQYRAFGTLRTVKDWINSAKQLSADEVQRLKELVK